MKERIAASRPAKPSEPGKPVKQPTIISVIPIAYVIERFIIQRLYGESVDYTFIATFAVTLIGVDAIKWIWGVNPYPLISSVLLGFPVTRIESPRIGSSILFQRNRSFSKIFIFS